MAAILYIGSAEGTSLARYEAIQRLGHTAFMLDPYECLPANNLIRRWCFKTGAAGFEHVIATRIAARIPAEPFDLVVVDNGELVAPAALMAIAQRGKPIVNLNQDNPYSGRDGRRFRLFLKSLPYYRVLYAPRYSSVVAGVELGAQAAVQFWFAADDCLKDPASYPTALEMAPFRAKVAFTGTWMEDRGEFIEYLLSEGIDVMVNGPRWDRYKGYERIKSRVRLGHLDQKTFFAAIAAADISIGLLSKGNLDLHTTRSMEIPALRSLLVAERTEDHEVLYEDGREAFFWSDPAECARVLKALVADPVAVERARHAGRARAVANNHFNEPLMKFVIEDALHKTRSDHRRATTSPPDKVMLPELATG